MHEEFEREGKKRTASGSRGRREGVRGGQELNGAVVHCATFLFLWVSSCPSAVLPPVRTLG